MTEFSITGMTCAGCARKVQTALQALSPTASVTLDPPRAILTGVTAEAANTALAQIGSYRVAPVQADPLAGIRAVIGPYYPLAVVLGLIALASFASDSWMMAFMAGFFIVFGAFKLLDIPAFARAYGRYDIVAARVPQWGYVYPFVELALGFAFLFHAFMGAATWAALILSLVGAVGVIRSVVRRETIQCACLGTVFNLPMSTVTIVENLGMAAMAAWMLTFGM
ncbi:MAG: heavy-metal-associated domain-containing protein [Paracoccaceae bacterium]